MACLLAPARRNESAHRLKWSISSASGMNPSGSVPSYGAPGSSTLQLGVTRQNESQRRRAPGLPDAAGLEDDVVDAWPASDTNSSQARPGRADDRDVDAALHDGGNRTGRLARALLDQVSLGRLDLRPLAIRGKRRRGPARPARPVISSSTQPWSRVTSARRMLVISVELLAELVDDRFLDHRRTEDELEPAPPHWDGVYMPPPDRGRCAPRVTLPKGADASPPATAGTIEISSFSPNLGLQPGPSRTSSSFR